LQISSFLGQHFEVSFPVCSMTRCAGPDQSPLFRTLTTYSSNATTGNFTKFLIDADGYATERFGPAVSPTSKAVRDALKYALPTSM